MPQFIIAYRGGTQPKTREAGAAQMADWQKWVADLGEAIVHPGQPLTGSKTVTADAVHDTDAANRLTGYSLVEAADFDAALTMAQSCPFLQMGDLEVAQLRSMG